MLLIVILTASQQRPCNVRLMQKTDRNKPLTARGGKTEKISGDGS